MWKKKTYTTNSNQPFKLNRTKIDLYFDCKRCFFLDQKYGIKRPHGAPLVLNNKVVEKLKSELDICRQQKSTHPQVLEKNINFIPTNNNNLDDWRNPFKGIKYHHKDTNFLLNGSIDDIWTNNVTKKNHCLIIKSTTKQDQLTYESIWGGYWRQLSFYSYLLNKNEVNMSNTGMIIFISTVDEDQKFSKNFSFNLNIFEKIPEQSNYCKYCKYYFNIKNKVNEKL